MKDAGGRAVAAALVVLQILSMLGTATASNSDPGSAQYAPRVPISIDGDSQFTAENGVTSGTGTASDPYLIQGWEITVMSTFGIAIFYTSAHFVIRDVLIHSWSNAVGVHLFTVSNGRVESVNVTDGGYIGILVESSADVTIVRNRVSPVTSVGIQVTGTARSTIESNTVVGAAGVGVYVYMGSNATIARNEISGSEFGIRTLSDPRVAILGNRLASNRYGIGVYDSAEARVSHNEVSLSGESGMYVDSSGRFTVDWNNLSSNHLGLSLFSSQGSVHHNRFIENQEQSRDTLGGIWDDGYPSGGNWWYDYTGRDNCSGPNQDTCPDPDGIGDSPYLVDGSVRDRYPLMPPYQRPFAAFEVSRRYGLAGEPLAFDASASYDADGTIAEYSWEFGDGNTGTGRTTTHAYATPGGYLIQLTVVDDEGRANSALTTLNIYPEVTLVPYESPNGFRVPVPQAWARQENADLNGVVVDLLLTGPVVESIVTNIIVSSEAIAGVREDRAFLEAVVDETMREVRVNRPDAGLEGPQVYRTLGGHGSITFVIRYSQDGMTQKVAIIASDPHDRVWAILLTASEGHYLALNQSFEEMLAGFEITLAPPAGTVDLSLVLLGGLGATIAIIVALTFLVFRRRARLGPPSTSPPAAPTSPAHEVRPCPRCGSLEDPATRVCSRCGHLLEAPPGGGPPAG